MASILTGAVCYALMLTPNTQDPVRFSGAPYSHVEAIVPVPKFIYGYPDLESAITAKKILMGGEDVAEEKGRLEWEASPAYKAIQEKDRQRSEERENKTKIEKQTWCKTHTCTQGGFEFENSHTFITMTDSASLSTIMAAPYRSVKIFPAPCLLQKTK